MQKAIVCIFAHPDDEAFGPSGTIHKLTKTNDVFLLCATKGEVGKNSRKSVKTLGEIRADELRRSAKILGVKKVYFLGFVDGTLSNSLYHKLASKIERHLKRLKPEIVMTAEPRGVSGHIDHITVSMATSFVFTKLKFIKEIYYHCITEEVRARFGNDYFIYFPPGYKRSEIDKIVKVSDVYDIKLAAMQAHKSQAHDITRILKARKGLPKEEYFLIRKK